MEQGNLTAAITSYNEALQLRPDYPEAHYNLGNIFNEQGNVSAAVNFYNQAIQYNYNYQEAHFNLSVTLLLGGDYKNGWEEYEWRSKNDEPTSNAHASPICEMWSGEIVHKIACNLLLVV